MSSFHVVVVASSHRNSLRGLLRGVLKVTHVPSRSRGFNDHGLVSSREASWRDPELATVVSSKVEGVGSGDWGLEPTRELLGVAVVAELLARVGES